MTFSLLFAFPAIETYKKKEVSIIGSIFARPNGPKYPILSRSDLRHLLFGYIMVLQCAGDNNQIWEGNRWIFCAFHHYHGHGRRGVERQFTVWEMSKSSKFNLFSFSPFQIHIKGKAQSKRTVFYICEFKKTKQKKQKKKTNFFGPKFDCYIKQF